MASSKKIEPYTYSSFEILKNHLKEKLFRTGIKISDSEAQRITFLSRRKYDRYDHFPLGESFYIRLFKWLSNFQKKERETAYKIIQSIKFIDQYELKELTISTFENIKNLIISEMKLNEREQNWYSYIESRYSKLEEELSKTIFIACADDIKFDFFRRYAMRTHPKPFKKDNFIEYYKINKKSLNSLPPFNRVILIDQLSASGTTVIRQDDDGRWTGKFPRFLDIWDTKLGDNPIYYCPYILSNVSNNNLDERLNKWKFEKNINYNFLINPTCKISTLPAISDENGNIDESSEVAKLCLKYYDRFIEDEHIRKGGGAQFGYGRAGLTLVFQSNCPNNSLYLLWHSYNDWYPLFPRVSHHR